MANVNQGNRPLSPHLSIYRPQITSVLSILNRITGIAMMLAVLLITWWFMAAAVEPAYFEFVDRLLLSWFGLFVMAGSLWAFWFHFFNGLRHLVWDTAKGLEMSQVRLSGWIAVILSVVATVASIALASSMGS